jgi:hypothetical protein
MQEQGYDTSLPYADKAIKGGAAFLYTIAHNLSTLGPDLKHSSRNPRNCLIGHFRQS